MFRYLVIFLIVLLTIILQLAFLPGLNQQFSVWVNLPLLLIIFLTFFYSPVVSFPSTLLMGLLLDFYSTNFFGFFILLFLTEFIILRFFSLHILQNRNLFSFVSLNIMGIIVWQIFSLALMFVTFKFSGQLLTLNVNMVYLLNTIYQLIVHLVIIFLLYKYSSVIKIKLSSTLVN